MENDYRIYATREKTHWGPIYWDFLYLTAMGFPVTLTAQQKRQFTNLLNNFHVFLPCAECRYHYEREIDKLSYNIVNKSDAFDVVLLLHNKVRARQKKTLFTKNDIISYHYRSVTFNYQKYIFIILTGCILLYFFKKYR